MPVSIASRQDVIRSCLDEIRGRISEAAIARGEDYWILAQIMGTAVWQGMPPAAFAAEQIFPTSASVEYLTRHGAMNKIPRKLATWARGWVLITGSNGATQSSGSTLTSQGGIQVKLDGIATIRTAIWTTKYVVGFDPKYPDRFLASDVTGLAVNDGMTIAGVKYGIRELPGGTLVVLYGPLQVNNPVGLGVVPATCCVAPVVALVSGSASNLAYLSRLTIDSPDVNIIGAATTLLIADGADDEDYIKWAQRIEFARSEYPEGGNRAQLLAWALAHSGVDRVFVYPEYDGPGTARLLPQGLAGARHLSAAKRTEIQTDIDPATVTALQPGRVGMGADISVQDFIDQPVAISLTIKGSAGYEPDWAGGGTLTSSGTPTVSRLDTTTNPLSLVRVGNRIAVQVGAAHALAVTKIASVDATGISLYPPLPEAPAVGALIYPGSALIEPVRDAVMTMVKDLGPGDTTPPSRFPAPSWESPDELTLSLITAAVKSVAGVLDVTVNSPVANVKPAARTQVTLASLAIVHI